MSEHYPHHEDEPEDEAGEREDDAEGQRLAENEQERPRTIAQRLRNAIEDVIPGDRDGDGH